MNINFAQYLIHSGIPTQTVFLLLVLPLIALLVSFFIHVVGIKSYGLYEPIVITYSLYAISPQFLTGLKFGIPVILISWFVSEAIRRVLGKIKISYASKISIKISIASLLMIFFFAIAARFGQNGYITVNFLPVVILITLVEAISLFQLKTDNIRTNLISLQMFLIVIFSYFIITSKAIQNFILAYPYTIIIPILLNIYVGKYRGLRFSEYIRFKDVLKND